MQIDASNVAKVHDVSTRRTVQRVLMIGTDHHHQLAKLPGGLGGLTSCPVNIDEFCPDTPWVSAAVGNLLNALPA